MSNSNTLASAVDIDSDLPDETNFVFWGKSVKNCRHELENYSRCGTTGKISAAMRMSALRVNIAQENGSLWTNFSLQDKNWAEFSTLEVAACIPCTYCPV
jgi:hypothetical protein